MKKHQTSSALSYGEGGAIPRSRALVALPRTARRPGFLATVARALVGILLLPVRIPVLAIVGVARGAAWIGSGAGRAVATIGRGLFRGTAALLTGLARLVAAPFVLGARLLVGMARLLGFVLGGAGRGGAAIGRGLSRGVVALLTGVARLVAAPFVLLARLLVGIVRLLGFVLGGTARGAMWIGSGAGRGIATLARLIVLLPIRVIVLLARLVALVARGLARVLVFVLRLPFLALRLAGRGVLGTARGVGYAAGAIAVPAVALAWGAVRYFAAGVTAVVRGLVAVFAFAGRLLGRGIAALCRGGVSGVSSLARGTFACVRLAFRIVLRIATLPYVALRVLLPVLARGAVVCGLLTCRLVLWIAILPFVGMRALVLAFARGAWNIAGLLMGAAATVAAGFVELVRGAAALGRLLGRAVGSAARPVGATLGSKSPQHACLLPLAALALVAGAEMFGPGGFPFATVALLIVAAFAALSALQRPTSVLAVLLAWGLAVATGWRAERVSLDTPAWLDALVYLSALAALRSAYVAARSFMREAPAAWRAAEQERAHRRASRAIGIVLAVQCVLFAVWSAAEGRLSDAPLFGELLLVGAGMVLAWVVRSGFYVRTAQVVLTLGALAALVGMIAAQFTAFAAGRLVTTASLGAFVLLMLMAGALTIVVHARLIDLEHGA